MDLTRLGDTFKAPEECINIIGCGAIGSHLALQLAKLGCKEFKLFDFDKVESYNIVNQAFNISQIGMLKTEATKDIILSINPEAEVTRISENVLFEEMNLHGYVFLCPDTVSARKHVIIENKTNFNIKGWFDCRTELFSIQAFQFKHKSERIERFLETLNFTDKEAEANIPRSKSGCRAKIASGITSSLGGLVLAKLFQDFVNNVDNKPFIRVSLDELVIDTFEI